MATQVRFDRFYTYADLQETLVAWVTEFPGLCEVESIGKSYEGREIPLVTVTNLATGAAKEKPAVFVHAQIHAMEFTGTTAALSLLDRLLHGYGDEERVTHALDTRAFYVVPRVNPDGAEAGLSDGRFRRSSVRPYPREEPEDGLHREDVDGDGRVLQMRVRDPNGPWKAHPDDAKLLVARRPDDVEGEFFRVFPEGTIRNWDGVTVKVAPPFEGLDLNRNWPAEWAPEDEQLGAGPYPGSEPETRALIQAIVDRPNITNYIGYHTFSGVHLRPYSGRPDDDFPTPDLRAFTLMGEEATRLTGYPAISIFHDFKYEPKQVIKGGDVDWVYDFLGVYAWVTEFWSPQKAAGIEDYHFIDWIRDHDPEDDLKLLAARGRARRGIRGLVPLRASAARAGRARRLGPRLLLVQRALLEARAGSRAARGLCALPRARLSPARGSLVRVDRRRHGVHRLSLVLENSGWLPTHVTQKALDRKAVRPIEVELELPEGTRIVTGKEREEAGQLAGRVEHRSVLWWNVDHSTNDLVKIEWVVEAAAGSRVGVTARHSRAGTARAEVVLSSSSS